MPSPPSLSLRSSASSLVASTTDTEHITRTEKLAPGGTLRLKNFSGRVVVTASDRSDVVIDAVRRGEREWLDRSKLEIYSSGSTLVVDANQHDHSSSWFNWTRKTRIVETDLDLKVPHRINLDVNVFSSPVTVTGVEGSHNIHGFSSRIQLDDVTGSVRAHTFSGSVEIRAKTWVENQSIDVDTFSGSIQLHVPENARGSRHLQLLQRPSEFRNASDAAQQQPALAKGRARRRPGRHAALQDLQRQRPDRPITPATIGIWP